MSAPLLDEYTRTNDAVSVIEGFKFVRKDGTTFNGYRWPLPMPGERVRVTANPGDREFTTGNPCPQFPGDGLCVASTAAAASSGGIRASEAIGLWLEYEEADILAEGDGKRRVRAVTVTGIFDVSEWVRTMCPGSDLSGANLYMANLSWANLSGANLSRANLSGSDLSRAYLSGSDLSWANLSGANLSGAYLSGAYLYMANLSGANLSGANLSRAYLDMANLSGAYGQSDWGALAARGAIR